MVPYTFYSRGHPNILGTHDKTLEFTKDREVSLKGDCIIGVDSDFDLKGLNELLKLSDKFLLTMEAGAANDSVVFYKNKGFHDDHELVIRKTDFLSERTIGIWCSKASCELSRELMKRMQDPQSKMKVTIKPVKIKAVIFDFDDTLANWDRIHNYVRKGVKIYVKRKLKLNLDEFQKAYTKVKEKLGMPYPVHPKELSRATWYREAFRLMGAKVDEKDILEMERIYWDRTTKKMELFSNALEVMKKFRGMGLKIGIVSDSDGDVKFKMMRIKKLGVDNYYDDMVLSDETGRNKPDKVNFLLIAKKLGVQPEECIMVGDTPIRDSMTPKLLGMTTVHFKRGPHRNDRKETYMDYQINRLTQVLEIAEKYE